jgi:UDP-3-O-[3-hydroxymyristoyl] glucosamine N-acyltransferase
MHTIAEIAELLNVPVSGDATRPVRGMASLEDAAPDQVTFLTSDQFLRGFRVTRAAAVIVDRRVQLPVDGAGGAGSGPALLTVEDAQLAVARVLALFAQPVPRPQVGRHHTAIVAPSASIGDGARIGPYVFVGDGARIGRNCVLHPGVYIGAGTSIGDDCEFFPNAVIRERCTVGHRVIIHANSAIGTDGFGYAWDGTQHVKIPQIGTVVIEDDVEIGSCSCVDRAKFSETRVGRGSKIDNVVQIGHNVRLGPNCLLAGQVGIAGSSTLGAGVVLGGAVAVMDHITIGDGSMVAACSGVLSDVPPKTVFNGIPAGPHFAKLREWAAMKRLPELLTEFRKLQQEVKAMREQLAKHED